MEVNNLTTVHNSALENEEVEQGEVSLIEEEVVQLVSFMLLDEIVYGINILSVHEILKVIEITRLPNTPSYIRGVINLRGNVIPVVDVRERFGFPKCDIIDTTRIIVVDTYGKLVGLIVDKVHQVIRMPLKNIDQPTEIINIISEEFLGGVGRLQDKLIIILNLDNILFPKKQED